MIIWRSSVSFPEDKMDCQKCDKRSVIELQHGNFCKNHFLSYFEEKVFKTISKYQLIKPKERICIAASGGKDSLTVLYLTKKYLEKNGWNNQIFALVVDEGIPDYREKTIKDLEKFCKDYDIELHKISFQEEFSSALEKAYPQIEKNSEKKPCNLCGVWRRYLLNKYSRKLGAEKLVTGHNLDDEAQAIMMNIFKANTKLAGRLGPITGMKENGLFVQRVKPLYFCPEKEVRLYALLKGFQVQFAECPYSSLGYRHHIQEMLNNFENKYHGTKQGIVQSFLDLLPLFKQNQDEKEEIKICQKCQEPSNGDVCNACKLKTVLENDPEI